MSDLSRGAGSGKTLTGRVFDGLQNLIAGLGSFRDWRSSHQYTVAIPQSAVELDALYSSSWLADKIVSIIPDDMTREWVDLSWDGLDDDPTEKRALTDAAEALGLADRTNEAAKWGRLYGGAVVFMGIAGEDPATPLNMAAIKKDSLKYLLVFDRWRCVANPVTDWTLGPNLDMPLSYRETRSGMTIHHSRVVRFGGRKLPWREKQNNQGWDGSVLQPVMDAVRDYDFTKAGIASMVKDANVDILGVEGLYDMLATADGESELTKRFTSAATLKSFNGMLLTDKTREQWSQKTIAFSGVNDVLEKFMNDVSGAADVPITRLFGRSPGGLNATGESDATNYNNHVAAKQRTHLRPPLKVLYEALVRSTLGRLPENFDFSFRPLSQMSATDKATIQKTNADRDKIYVDLGVLTEGAVARQLKDDNVYSTLEEEDVQMAEELAQQPEPEARALPAAAKSGGALPPKTDSTTEEGE